jgi:hypothetical protein
MGVETRLCPACSTPVEFDVSSTMQQAACQIGQCLGCDRVLFYIPGDDENTTHWHLLD